MVVPLRASAQNRVRIQPSQRVYPGEIHETVILCPTRQFESSSDSKELPMPATAKKPRTNTFMKPVRPSEQLARIVGSEPLPRTEVTKKVWAHIKRHKLQNPENKREIIADDKLQAVFGGKKMNMFEMTKAINKHLKS